LHGSTFMKIRYLRRKCRFRLFCELLLLYFLLSNLKTTELKYWLLIWSFPSFSVKTGSYAVKVDCFEMFRVFYFKNRLVNLLLRF